MKSKISTTFLSLFIVGCSFSSEKSAVKNDEADMQKARKVLVVVSAADTFELSDGFLIESGYFISELGAALRRFDENGIEVDIATPGGVTPTVDTHGLDLKFYMISGLTNPSSAAKERDLDLLSAEKHFGLIRFSKNKVAPELENTIYDFAKHQAKSGVVEKKMLRLEDLTESKTLDTYAGIFIPGGHAPKVDLAYNNSLGKILSDFHAKGKPTAIICHAPIVLLSTISGWSHDVNVTEQQKESFPYFGYNITIGSQKEEWLLENVLYLRGHKLKYYVEDEAREAGLSVNTNRIPSMAQVVVDRELMTGGNPASTHKLADMFLDKLKSQHLN